jgi:putative DNA primase/helicase
MLEEKTFPCHVEGPVVRHPFTDSGNAERYCDRYAEDTRFNVDTKEFLLYGERSWEVDMTGRTTQRMVHVARKMGDEAKFYFSPSDLKDLEDWKKQSENRNRIENAMHLVKSQPGIAIRAEILDANRYLFNMENGTLDLKTGSIWPHDRANYITRIAPVHYDSSATCPLWEDFVYKLFGGNKNIIEFVQRLVGYSLTGNVGEQILIMLFGDGGCGKSTFAETIQNLMGKYSKTMAPGLLVETRNDLHPTAMADLFGTRFAVTAEIEEGQRLKESLTKQLTGGDRIKARKMFHDYFEFQPTHKIWMLVNHLPVIRGTDDGIWRRIIVIPCHKGFSEAERDIHLLDTLLTERSGILNWAIQGLKDWLANGLQVPLEIRQVVEEYRTGMDTVSLFLSECCLYGSKMHVTVDDMYQTFAKWCEDAGRIPLSKRALGIRLKQRFSSDKIGGKRGWLGVGLKSERDDF